MQRDFEQSLHGIDPDMVSGGGEPGQPAIGSDPTQEKGTDAWQRAIRMGMQINARNRRN